MVSKLDFASIYQFCVVIHYNCRSNLPEAVVAESVVVIKRLLQTQAADPKEIITHMARLLDSITVAQARAAILWLLGEHSQKVPLIAPDVLRKMAITFGDEVKINRSIF